MELRILMSAKGMMTTFRPNNRFSPNDFNKLATQIETLLGNFQTEQIIEEARVRKIEEEKRSREHDIDISEVWGEGNKE